MPVTTYENMSKHDEQNDKQQRSCTFFTPHHVKILAHNIITILIEHLQQYQQSLTVSIAVVSAFSGAAHFLCTVHKTAYLQQPLKY